jgi:hypothetical protein
LSVISNNHKFIKMKKLLFITIALYCFDVNAQEIFIAESINDGYVFDLIANQDTSNTNTICIEVNYKNATVQVTNLGETRLYHIDNIFIKKRPEYREIFCSSKSYPPIVLDVSPFNTSFVFENLVYYAEMPRQIQSDFFDKLRNQPDPIED